LGKGRNLIPIQGREVCGNHNGWLSNVLLAQKAADNTNRGAHLFDMAILKLDSQDQLCSFHGAVI
jgi:hypothetical protein